MSSEVATSPMLHNLAVVMPEIVLLSAICVVLVLDLFLSKSQRIWTHIASLLALLLTAAWVWSGMPEQAQSVFSGSFVRDPLSDLLKLFVLLSVGLGLVYARDSLAPRGMYRGEFYLLALFGTLGMLVLISAHNLLTLYLGLELMSLSMYALVALQRDSARASEAAMKYFVLGALASGFFLYGASMLYGLSGSLQLREVADAVVAAQEGDRLFAVFGLVFVLVGMAFKLGAVPFHMWVPDVYQGSPTAVTLYLASAPKLAAFALILRVLTEGLGSLQVDWQQMLMVLAVLSMGLGNLVAIAQTNLKRMLAYSGISHAGFLLLGLLSGTQEGYGSALFYVVIYALTSAAAFGLILIYSRAGFEAENLEDWKGVGKQSPLLALMMLIVMFSMAGVPPTVGFYAKLSVLQAVVGIDLIGLAIIAVVFAVIGAFYYLRVIKFMFFDPPAEDAEGAGTEAVLARVPDATALMSLNTLALLALGLMPGPLMTWCLAVFAV